MYIAIAICGIQNIVAMRSFILISGKWFSSLSSLLFNSLWNWKRQWNIKKTNDKKKVSSSNGKEYSFVSSSILYANVDISKFKLIESYSQGEIKKNSIIIIK